MIDWQPMSTAPKDRRILLAWAAGTLKNIEFYAFGYWFPTILRSSGDGYWADDSTRFTPLQLKQNPPVAWAELTPVPDTLKASE
jgi:hypothetical protein